MSIRAADDFEKIHRRLNELRLERIRADGRIINLKGERIGTCEQCKVNCVPCQGYCCDD
jgi:tetrahydromethanopterin S-methyltransferase subunit G